MNVKLSDAGGYEARIARLSPEKRRLLAHLLRDSAPAAPGSGPRLAAFVTTAEGAVEPDELRRFAQGRLPHYMVPTSIEVLHAIPRTPNGKVDHERLRRGANARPAQPRPAAVAPASSEVEQRLRAIWAELLGVDDVSPNDDFFALGGHSLLAVRMLARVKAELGYDVPVALIVEAPTVARIAEHIRATGDQAAARPAILSIQPRGALPPLYFLPLHMHGSLHYRHLKAWLGEDRPLYGFEGFDLRAPATQRPTIETLARGYVEALLQFQPRGPYYLSGNSVAGLLAFEMARQLRERGVSDVAAILFDTWGPGYPDRLPARRLPANLAEQVKALGARGVAPLTHATDLLINAAQRPYAAAKVALARPRLLRAGTPAGPLAANIDPDLSLGEVDVALGKMIAEYLATPHPYAGSIVLFQASIQPWGAHHDPTLGWGRFVQGAITVEYSRGDHLGILKRLWAGQLAAQLLRQLARLDRQLDPASTDH
jgi:thioesterase domain-containing protein/acyl carrier protein